MVRVASNAGKTGQSLIGDGLESLGRSSDSLCVGPLHTVVYACSCVGVPRARCPMEGTHRGYINLEGSHFLKFHTNAIGG